MKTIKVSELQPGPQMDALVAEARGWEAVMLGGTPVWCSKKGFAHHLGELVRVSDYRPSTNGGQAMELVKAFKIDVLFRASMTWEAVTVRTNKFGEDECITQFGETPEIAICRAVIASKFGEYAEVDG